MSQQGILSDRTSPAADVETLTGNSGGAVGPDSGYNINVVGSGAVSVAGNPATNTLTISLSGGGGIVNSVTGTANQILASPTTGAVVVSLTNGISIGSYQAVSSPTGGLIMPGQLGVGTSSPNSLAKFQVNTSTAYNTLFSGTQTADDGTLQGTLIVNSTMAPTNSGMVTYAAYLLPTFNAPGGGTIAGAASLWITASASGNTATISELASIKIDTGTAGGTITNGYGIYVRSLAYGTNRYAGYFQNPAAGTIAIALYGDNASIGYNVSPPSNGLIVSGQTAIGTSSANSKAILTLVSTTLGFLPPVMTTTQKNAITSPTSGLVVYDSILNDLQFYNGASWVSNSGVTSITGTANQITASASTGAVTLSFPNGISIGSYQATSSPTGGIIAPGQLGIGTNAPNSLAIAQFSTTKAYNTIHSGTQTADDGSTQATVVVNSVMAPTNSGMTTWANYILPTFNAPVAGTIAGAAGVWITASASGNTGTIAEMSSIKVDIGTAGGTITAGYGIFVRSLAYGTNRYGGYFQNPSAGTVAIALYGDNASIGYNVSPPSNGVIVSGQTSIGTSSPNSKAILTLVSTTLGFLPPVMTTTQKNAIATPPAGLVVYDSVSNDLEFYNGVAWTTASGGVTSIVGTANQVLANGTVGSSQTGTVTLTLPQSINTTATVQFGSLGLGTSPLFDLDIQKSTAGSFVSAHIKNSSASANSDSAIFLQTTNGSPYISYTVGATTYFTVGVDSADSNRFKFSAASSIGSSDVLTILPASVFVNSALTVGSATPQGNTQVTLNPTGQYGIYMTSTMAQAGVALYAMRINNIISPTTAFATYGFAFTGSFNAVSGRTIPNAYAFYSDITTTASGGTVSNLYNFYSSPGTNSASTLTNVYGHYAAALSVGTNRYGGYFLAPTAGTIAIAMYADNGSFGYAVSPPSNGLIISGQLGVGTSAPNALAKTQIASTVAYNTLFSGTQTTDDGSTQATVVVNSVMAPTNSGMSTYAIYGIPTFNAPGGGTIAGAACLWVSASASGNTGTITDMSSIKVDIGTAGGTITTGYGIRIRALAYGSARYGLYVENPSAGSPAIATYSANASIGSYTATAAPSNGIIVSGSSGFGTSSPATGTGLAANYGLSGTTGNLINLDLRPTLTCSSGTVTAAYGEYNLSAFVKTGNITTTASLYIDASTSSGAGTITTHYGIRVVAPTVVATTSYGLYVDAPTGASTNYGARINGQIGLCGAPGNTASISLTSTSLQRIMYVTGTNSAASVDQHAIQFEYTSSPTAGQNSYTMTLNSAFSSPAGGLNVCAGFYANIAAVGSGTINEVSGLKIDAGAQAGPTVTTGYGVNILALGYGTTRYGLYVAAQSGGSTNVCAYFGGPIQFGTNTTGAGTALLSTNSPAVTNTAPYTWLTLKSSDGSTVYVPAWK